jgi:hypothetical protein
MNDPEMIRALAYRLWEQRGRPHGSAEIDWAEAERRLRPSDAAAHQVASAAPSERTAAADALPNRPPQNVEVQLDELDRTH